MMGLESRGGRLRSGAACFVLAGILPLLAVIEPSYAQSGRRGSIVTSAETVESVEIILNKSKTFTLSRAFSTVTVGNGEIAEALPMSDRVLYVQGKKVGTTNISLFDTTARLVSVIDVEVRPESRVGPEAKNQLQQLLQTIRAIPGGRGIRVTPAGDSKVLLSGSVPDAVSADRAVSLARSMFSEGAVVNGITVDAAQQVMLKVRFLEVTRQAGRELGVNWFVGNRAGNRGINTGLGTVGPLGRSAGSGDINTNTGLASSGPVDSSGNPAVATGVPLFQTAGTLLSGAQPFGVALASLVNKGTSVDVLISALETKNLVRRLAEPDLVALSGDMAAFLAGGEFPVQTVQPGAAGVFPIITTEYKPFGVQLTFTPTVLAHGKINLRLAPSVSELDFANAVIVSGFRVPALSKREARTTIELRDGQSFAIAGLLQSHNRRDVSQLPWIGSVPVLGTLFGSKSFQQDETDLVVIVTPHLVAPAAPGQQIASPLDSRVPSNDLDFFLNGQMEQKKEYQDFVSRGGGVQGPYGHMIRPDVAVPRVVAPRKEPVLSVKN